MSPEALYLTANIIEIKLFTMRRTYTFYFLLSTGYLDMKFWQRLEFRNFQEVLLGLRVDT